jgi:hypothetical protein
MTETLTGLGTTDVTIGVGVAGVVDGYTLGDNAALVDLGTVTDDGPFQFGYYLADETLTIATGGVFEMVAGGTIFEPTGNSSAIFNDGLFEAAGTALSTVAVPFFNLTGGTLGSGTAGLELLEGGTIGGRLEGPGEIDLGAGVFTLFSSAVGALGTLAIGDSGSVALGPVVVYLDGDLTVASELELFGGGGIDSYYTPSTLVNNNLLLATGSGYSMIEASFTNGNTATIVSDIGALEFTDGGILAGTLGGTGEIELAGGDFLLLPNAVVNVASLEIWNSTLTLDGNLSLANAVLLNGTIDLNGYTLDQSSPFAGNAALAGSGTLNISGSAEPGQLDLYDSVIVNFTGSFGSFNGDFESPDARLNIADGSTWETDGFVGGYNYGTLVNAGTLIELAPGVTEIESNFTQTGSGVIDVKQGAVVLEGGATIAGSILGKGELELNTEPFAGNGYLLLSPYIDLTPSVLDVATLDIGLNVGLGENLDYGGTFIVSHNNYNETQPYLQLNGYTLDLSGHAIVDGDISGPGLVNISGSATIYGGIDAPVVIDRGTLLSASDFSDGLTFHGKGELIIPSSMPSETIHGFGPGDKIKLEGVTYHAGAKVKVKEAGVVEIIDGGATYSLNIAGATVGSHDFSFGKGSVLTTSAKAKMDFLRPETSGVAASGDELVVAPVMSPVTAAAATIAAAPGGLGHELLALVRAAMDVPVGFGNFG